MPDVPPEVASATVADLLVWVAFIMLLIGAGAGIRKRVKPFIDKLHQFLDDWAGEPERPGVPERLGVMARLSAVEHELKPNGGSSFYDKLTKRDQERDARLEEMSEQLGALAETVKRIDGIVECCLGKEHQ